ncbi:MAG: T9SS type A sorting domain-containing protein [Candidatus Paceibacterota bacterium]
MKKANQYPNKMKTKTACIIATIILTLSASSLLLGQQAVVAAGAEATGSGGTASYSVGQVVCQTHTGTSGSVAEGVQQPYEISVLSSTKDVTGVSLTCSVYPNPTADYLTLKVENYAFDNLRYQMFDMQGKLLESKIIISDQTNIPMNAFTPATYILKVIHSNNEITTFSIIKR